MRSKVIGVLEAILGLALIVGLGMFALWRISLRVDATAYPPCDEAHVGVCRPASAADESFELTCRRYLDRDGRPYYRYARACGCEQR